MHPLQRLILPCLAILALLLTGCGSMKVVWTETTPGFTLKPGMTYAWLPSPSPVTLERQGDPEALDLRIQNAVHGALGARGLKKAAKDQATVHVRYIAVFEEVSEERDGAMVAMSDRADMDGDFGSMLGGTADRDEVSYDEGMLILQFLDPATGKQVWRGAIQAEVHRKRLASAQHSRLRSAIDKLLAEVPTPGI